LISPITSSFRSRSATIFCLQSAEVLASFYAIIAATCT
jgi:hypothetical protein